MKNNKIDQSTKDFILKVHKTLLDFINSRFEGVEKLSENVSI